MAVDPTDLANSLAQDEIPIKLRCASCNKLVINAFRLPCCEQNICENCHESLPESCPVCEHSPLSADDCKPNKALRLTVKAFLKNEEKKRDKEKVDAAPAKRETPALTESVVQSIEKPDEVEEQGSQPGIQSSTDQVQAAESAQPDVKGDASLDQSKEPADAAAEVVLREKQSFEQTNQVGTPAQESAEQAVGPLDEDWNKSQDVSQQQMFNTGFGFQGMNNAFGNQDWSNTGAFNPMMAMNGMSGMNFGGWGGFPNMMGMPGMGMEPMMMSNGMFGGFNGQSMGMNGMNMGMSFNGGYGSWVGPSAMSMSGMNGGDFGANAGYYPGGGYNQQSHQGHFNQMQHQRQQFPMNNYSQQNRFRGQGFSSQRNLGRGYRSHQQQGSFHERSGSSQPSSNSFGGQTLEHVSTDEREAKIHGTATTEQESGHSATNGEPQESSFEVAGKGAIKSEKTDTEATSPKPADDTTENVHAEQGASTRDIPADAPKDETANENAVTPADESADNESFKPQPIATVDMSEPVSTLPSFAEANTPNQEFPVPPPAGPASTIQHGQQFGPGHAHGAYPRGRGAMRGFGRGAHEFRGGFRGRGGFMHSNAGGPDGTGLQPVQPIGQGVAGAPTGPKAMREGLPNVGYRGRGAPALQVAGRSDRVGAPPSGPAATQATGRESNAASPTSSRSRARSFSPSKSRSRSPSASQPQSGEQRLGSKSDVEDDRNDTKLRQPRPNEEMQDDDLSKRNGDGNARARDSSRESASRHPERNDRDRDRRDRERDRSRENRSRRYRSRSPAVDDARDKLKETHSTESSRRGSRRERERERRRDRNRDRRERREGKRSSARSRSPPADSHERDAAPAEPREFKIKDRSKQLAPQAPPPSAPRSELDAQKEAVLAERPDIDPHTLEREARNRERMAKERQRREEALGGGNGGSGGGGRKRSLGEMNGGAAEVLERQRSGSRRKVRHGGRSGGAGRRANYHYEGDENDEDRARRIEDEREAARWG